MNFFNKIHEGTLTSEEAIEIINKILDSDDAEHIQKILNVSKQEWTAFAQGASLVEISRWRHEGWPINCFICGLSIDVDEFKWKIVENSNNESVLKHLICPILTRQSNI